MLVDTHCHIHEDDYQLDQFEVLKRANQAGVTKIICIGTDEISSRQALDFAVKTDGVYASIGVHPHDVKNGIDAVLNIVKPQQMPKKLVAVGEIGLDYFYAHSPRVIQITALEAQIDLAERLNLPISFHVRDAPLGSSHSSVWSDFWPIIDSFHKVRGVIHSFTDTNVNLDEALKRGLYIGVNGISTFTKDKNQQAMFARIPLQKMLLETDAPFLTPAPYRGTINEPAFVNEVAAASARIRGISLDEVAAATTANADALFFKQKRL